MRSRSSLSRRIIWLTLPSLLWAVLLASNTIPQLRGGFGWRWAHDTELDLGRIAPFILAVAVYVPVALQLRRRSMVYLLAWAIAGSIGLSIAAVHVRGDVAFRLFTVTVGGMPSGWHTAAARISNLPGTLRQWHQFMEASGSFSSHITTSPPGMVIIYWAANSLLARFPAWASALAGPLRLMQCHNMALMEQTDAQLASAWLGMLIPVWSGLTVLPLFRLGRDVFGQEAAQWSVVWWPLVPSVLLFAPLPNTLHPFLSLMMVILLFEGLRRSRPSRVLAAGVLMSALTFTTFTFMPLLLLAGFLTLGMFWLRRSRARLPWHWPLQMGMWFGLGLSATWLILYALTGEGFWDVWQAAIRTHQALGRPYWPWLVLNLNDFAMFAGWPLALLAGIGLWRVVRQLFSRKVLGESDIMILAAALTLAVVDLSGTLRGESGRLLLFLSPWVVLAAAAALDGDRGLGSALTVVQAILLVVMVTCLHVLHTGLGEAPSSPPYMAEPVAEAQVLSCGALFGDVARLKAFSGRIEARYDDQGRERSVLVLWLNWEPLKPMSVPYYLVFLPVAPDGEVAASATLLQPFSDRYPTTCWKPCDGELRDQFEVPLFKTQTGDWWISFSLIDAKTVQSLGVVAPDGSRDQQIGLGPFH